MTTMFESPDDRGPGVGDAGRVSDGRVSDPPLLQVRGASKAFPGVQALEKVDFDAYAGEVVALLGENGAGKSTLMKILSGAYQPDEGEIRIGGVVVEPRNPHHAQELGIATIYQELNLTPNQTVWQNIFLGREQARPGVLGKFGLTDRARMRREAQAQLDRVGAHFSVDDVVRSLSVAQQQMVEIAKALAVQAKVIIMDEPTSSLGKEEVGVLFRLVQSLKAQGLAVIFITHRLEEVFQIADRITVLRDGRLVDSVMARETNADRVITMMVGRALDRGAFAERTFAAGDVVLAVRGVSRTGVLHGISFDLRRGEILGFAGLVGAGRTETARAIFGADPIDAGEIALDGHPIKIDSPETAVRAGLALVPENRKEQGLVLGQTIERNIALPNLGSLARNGFVSGRLSRALVQSYIDKLNIRTPSAQQRAMNLSGGNQQKVVLAKWLAAKPKVLILDEPTRGIDVGAKAEVYAIMRDLARQGLGIIMISSEMPEVLAMSDRIVVMCEGRITRILNRAEATQELILAYASNQEVARVT